MRVTPTLLSLILLAGVLVHGQTTQSLAALQARAASGNAEAQYLLGRKYANADGVAQNYSEANRWCRLSANQGHAGGQACLGSLLVYGRGVEKNEQEAVRLIRLSAATGHPRGLVWMGNVYYLGLATKADPAEAAKWYKAAADSGDAEAQGNLGYLYAAGLGVVKDEKEAFRLFSLAAAGNHAGSQQSLGLAYLNGNGVPKDPEAAMKWFRVASDQGNPDAQTQLGYQYRQGKLLPLNYQLAVRYFRMAADQKHARAQLFLGISYANGQGVEKDTAEAVKWYRLAADQGDPDAKARLAELTAPQQPMPPVPAPKMSTEVPSDKELAELRAGMRATLDGERRKQETERNQIVAKWDANIIASARRATVPRPAAPLQVQYPGGRTELLARSYRDKLVLLLISAPRDFRLEKYFETMAKVSGAPNSIARPLNIFFNGDEDERNERLAGIATKIPTGFAESKALMPFLQQMELYSGVFMLIDSQGVVLAQGHESTVLAEYVKLADERLRVIQQRRGGLKR